MGELALFVLLVLALVAGLALIPFGLPGIWIMVAALIGYAALGGFQRVGVGTLALAAGAALASEAAEAWLGFRLTRRYGASSRAAWGAVVGGLAGAVLGTPVPIIGNVVGAFLGAFVGAVMLEFTAGAAGRGALAAGWGALLGRAAGAAVKIAAGLFIAIVGLFAALG
ncbi:MAG: DUF456 domain-containing protein [Gemmatimonadota bacterium]|nr:MAG: DUF456 domain-containing protein [Gemmatimonadota bacterium]